MMSTMPPMLKEISVKRQDHVGTYRHCPRRPYVELELPKNFQSVSSARLLIQSYNIGTTGKKERHPRRSSLNASVRRPPGKSALGSNEVDDVRNSHFDETARVISWDRHNVNPGFSSWGHLLKSLAAGDIIQLTPAPRGLYGELVIEGVELVLQYEHLEVVPEANLPPKTSPSFTYSRGLDTSSCEIRILDLQPGIWTEPLVCRIGYCKLNDNLRPDYEAVSYCWGNTEACAEIIIEDHPADRSATCPKHHVMATRSAEFVLRCLRYSDRSRLVWIDALCINQQDNTERSQQVSMMAEIFSQASTVQIWLQTQDEKSTLALRVIRDIYNAMHRICPGEGQCACPGTRHLVRLPGQSNMLENMESADQDAVSTLSSILGAHIIPDEKIRTRDFHPRGIVGNWVVELNYYMAKFFAIPWFSRVWVIQEALGARRAYVHCGHEMIPWGELVEVNAKILERVMETIATPNDWRLALMPSIWSELLPTKLMGQARPGLLDVFLHALDLKATIPRDRLYALLSFGAETSSLASLPELLQPDYDQDEGTVFARFTRWCIIEYGSLRVLSAIHSNHHRTWQSTWCSSTLLPDTPRPTWAIRGDGRYKWVKANLNEQFKFRACGKTIPDKALLQKSPPLTLQLRGFRVSTLRQIAHFPVERQYQDISVLREAFYRILDPNAFQGHWNGDPQIAEWYVAKSNDTKETRYHPQRHWLNKGSDKSLTRQQPKLDVLDLEAGRNEDGLYNTKKSDKYYACIDPCFFASSNGLVGLCPARAREGDLIVVLFGGNVPFLLRRASENPEDDQFEFVGECYVEGIMNGEFVEEKVQAGCESEIFTLV